MMSKMLKLTPSMTFLRRPAVLGLQQQPKRNLNLLEYQSKGLLQNYDVTVQKFRVASTAEEAVKIPQDFPCKEYVIKAQVLAGGRGKGHFDNGFKVYFFFQMATSISDGSLIRNLSFGLVLCLKVPWLKWV